jgi:hypothetical protein
MKHAAALLLLLALTRTAAAQKTCDDIAKDNCHENWAMKSVTPGIQEKRVKFCGAAAETSCVTCPSNQDKGAYCAEQCNCQICRSACERYFAELQGCMANKGTARFKAKSTSLLRKGHGDDMGAKVEAAGMEGVEAGDGAGLDACDEIGSGICHKWAATSTMKPIQDTRARGCDKAREFVSIVPPKEKMQACVDAHEHGIFKSACRMWWAAWGGCYAVN